MGKTEGTINKITEKHNTEIQGCDKVVGEEEVDGEVHKFNDKI